MKRDGRMASAADCECSSCQELVKIYSRRIDDQGTQINTCQLTLDQQRRANQARLIQEVKARTLAEGAVQNCVNRADRCIADKRRIDEENFQLMKQISAARQELRQLQEDKAQLERALESGAQSLRECWSAKQASCDEFVAGQDQRIAELEDALGMARDKMLEQEKELQALRATAVARHRATLQKPRSLPPRARGGITFSRRQTRALLKHVLHSS